uniref:Uncharacterized protein n=1 Tax=Meloidogyne enterolobii TaxID=390850 RepID=A0A6V7X735_MELEN|nr:unnamed protein product [Meloidogyne enterolobii]
MVQYNSENTRRKRRSSNSKGKLLRELLKAIFGDEAVKKLDTLIGYLAIGFLYFIYIAGPIYEYIYRIHCTFPDLTWFRNLRPFGRGNGQNNGGNQVVVQQPQIQPQPVQPMLPQMHPNLVHHIRPQVPPQILPPQIRPNLQQQMGPHFNPQIQPQNIIHNPHPHQRPPIPWFQQANSFTNISYTSMPSSSDPMSFYNRSYNPQPGQPSGYQPHILLEDSDDESINSDGRSPSPDYSYQDRKRRSVSLMSKNTKGKDKNEEIQKDNSDKNLTINSANNADANQNDSEIGDIYLKSSVEKIKEGITEQQKSDKKFKGF